ncbi:MAG TPA: winged helix-turn-helix transcriptional regulator [Jatrophihabitantaceae bacterium]
MEARVAGHSAGSTGFWPTGNQRHGHGTAAGRSDRPPDRRGARRDGRRTLKQLADATGLSVSAVQARVRRLEADGIIQG